jgi:hypothetical protein
MSAVLSRRDLYEQDLLRYGEATGRNEQLILLDSRLIGWLSEDGNA